MKKFTVLLCLTIIVCLTAFANEARFINALKYCTIYSEDGSVNSNGTSATSSKKILGWQGDRCIYKESVQMGVVNADVICKFTKPQLQEIASVMDAYMLTLKYSGEEIDTSSPEAVQNNPVVKVWGKYMQDSNVCTIDAK